MLEFHKATLSDKDWVNKCLTHAGSYNCEYTFGNLFVWSTAYCTEICHYNDFLICRWGRGDDISYSLPIGEGDFSDAVIAIVENAKELGVTPKIYGITDGYLAMLQEAFTGKFSYEFDDGYNDYIYSVQKMTTLAGKKYHGKRNHINNFNKNNPDWIFELIDSNNIDDCIAFHKKWIESRDADDEDYSFEFEAVLTAFEHYDSLGFIGGLIRVDGEVVAYTMGEPMLNGKCFVTHFEKADGDIQGAYTIINQEFTKRCLSDYEFVNREEDLGIDGLRRAKQSYYPELWLRKCVATYDY